MSARPRGYCAFGPCARSGRGGAVPPVAPNAQELRTRPFGPHIRELGRLAGRAGRRRTFRPLDDPRIEYKVHAIAAVVVDRLRRGDVVDRPSLVALATGAGPIDDGPGTRVDGPHSPTLAAGGPSRQNQASPGNSNVLRL